MPKFNWIIEEVVTAEASTDSVNSGEVDLQDLEVSKLPEPEIKEADENVALTSVSGGTVEKTGEMEKKVIAPQEEFSFDGGKRFNQIVIAILVGLTVLVIVPAVFVFVVVAGNDIWHGRLDLEKYINLVIALIYGLGTFLAGLGTGSFIQKKTKIDSG